MKLESAKAVQNQMKKKLNTDSVGSILKYLSVIVKGKYIRKDVFL